MGTDIIGGAATNGCVLTRSHVYSAYESYFIVRAVRHDLCSGGGAAAVIYLC